MNTFPRSIPSELLKHACPSIQYRTRLEILHEPVDSLLMQDLQNQILELKAVQDIICLQEPEGWLSQDFHGYNSTESGLRFLREMGLSCDHPVITRSLKALDTYPGRLYLGIGKVGLILDELGFGGSQMIRAFLFAKANVEDKPFIQDQIEIALDGFRSVLNIEDIKQITEPYLNLLVFKPGISWPGIYHLRLLALTKSWRTPKNKKILCEAVERLIALSPIPDIKVCYKSQWIAPVSFCMLNFVPDMESMNDGDWMMWFRRMELLSRMGIVDTVSELRDQVNTLEHLLNDSQGIFTKKLNHYSFKKWGAYTGLMLEEDWRSPKRRVYDLTFRSYLILHYSSIRN